MCGIIGIFNVKEQSEALRRKALEMSRRLRHRGPDWSGIWCGGSAVLTHERLSIVDPKSGGQPLLSPDGKQVLAVNGEIYNHQEIRRRYAGKYDFRTGSDCEVILALYRDKGPDFLEDLSGIFAFALYDAERFPIHTPQNKEEYYYRSIFSELFPSNSAALCVPSEASVACSTAVALEWDAAFRNLNEPSGRAVADIHQDA